tara:strand:+ start:48 stop:440 length:393 start_codon:yes stop_codon:yes gene_type:complete
MDESLTNLVNESQIEEKKYKLELNISEDDRINISKILFIISFIINIFILFGSELYINIIGFIISQILVNSGISLIYKNLNYIEMNLILFSIYVISIVFELILIINNNNKTNFIAFVSAIAYQSLYIANYE